MLKEVSKKYNQAVCKIVGTGDNKTILFTVLKVKKTKGIETGIEPRKLIPVCENDEKVLQEREDCNLSRTKAEIYELARCNEWQYFFTGTIDPSKYDREDLHRFHRALKDYIKNLRRKDIDIKYLFVPELHDDKKSWHLHGFLMGVPDSMLHQFQIGDKMGKKIAQRVRQGRKVFNWLDYQERFGFNDLEFIESNIGASKYVTKYISKGLRHTVMESNAHMYYCSLGLKRAKIVAQGDYIKSRDFDEIPFDFENDYIKRVERPYTPELEEFFRSLIHKTDYIECDGVYIPVEHDLRKGGILCGV